MKNKGRKKKKKMKKEKRKKEDSFSHLNPPAKTHIASSEIILIALNNMHSQQ